jgi:hypothetical protein
VIKILINDRTKKVFWFLWKNRKEPYTIREISRQATVSYGSTWSILREFEELGLSYGIEKRRAHFYVLNFENPICFHVWSLLNALRRESLTIDAALEEKIGRISAGFAVYYPTDRVFKVLCCSEEKIEEIQSVNLEEFKQLCTKEKELYAKLWNEGIVLAGEEYFYNTMWELAEKKVIGVSI